MTDTGNPPSLPPEDGSSCDTDHETAHRKTLPNPANPAEFLFPFIGSIKMDLTGKHVLVTGAGGFIGSHLAEALVDRGCRVRAFVRYNSNNRWGWLENTEKKTGLEVVAGDIRDFDSVLNAARGVDVVFHLAALIGIPYSYVSPLAYIRTNVEGTYNILESCRALGTARVLITSTSETYGTAQYVPIDEKHPAVGQSPYSATKIAADQIAASYFRSFNLPVTIVRPFNTYGPRQSARAVIPTIIAQALADAGVRLGNLSPTRDFTYVKDTVDGFLRIAESHGTAGETFNLGTNSEVSVEELVSIISRLLNRNIEVETDAQRARPDASEVDRLRCENSKVRRLTGWTPRYDLERGLRETIEWIASNPGAHKAEIYNI